LRSAYYKSGHYESNPLQSFSHKACKVHQWKLCM
jgi:hypothetical protein